MPSTAELLLKVDASICVGIQITNNTTDVILENPRTYCFSGHVENEPVTQILPGSSESCVFVKTSHAACGSVGVLSYESDAFTLAIMFSNPYDCNIYYREFALELFTGRKHFESMESLYHYMYSHRPPFECESYRRMELKESQDGKLIVSNEEILVKATMSNDYKAIIKVEIEKKGTPPPPYSVHVADPRKPCK